MKLTFIMPGIGKKSGRPYTPSWRLLPPISFAILKAHTRPDIEVELFDDRIELIDFATRTDLVAISAEAYTAQRAYAVARRFRERGIPVVIGGSQATFVPDEVAEHADAVYVGNAEDRWAELVEDFRAGRLQRRYVARPGFGSRLPDRSIFAGKRYYPIGFVETGRGCRFRCDFCCIASYYGAHYHPRPIPDIVEDIRRWGRRYVFLLDDNIAADPAFAAELFDALAPLGIRWISQASLTVAKNEALLDRAARSGCRELFIGFETLEPESLRQIHKEWNLAIGDVDEHVRRIHARGIAIYASFVFGFDHDTPATFEKVSAFSARHAFQMAGYNILLPYPGTALHEQLRRAGRLLNERWWLDPGYKYGDVPFRPAHMTPEEVTLGALRLRKELYRFGSISRRVWQFLRCSMDPWLLLMTLGQYLSMHAEADEKVGTPLGQGLDELPK